MKTKICFKCKEEKLIEFFYTDIIKKDGLSSYCKECRKLYVEKYYADNKNEYLEHYKKNRDKILLQSKKYGLANKEKISEYAKKYYELYKEEYRIYQKKHNIQSYGITMNDYDNMYIEQNGVCAICGKPETRYKGDKQVLSIDHDHVTGKVRGLLCNSCNTAIGLFKDDLGILASAFEYLEFRK